MKIASIETGIVALPNDEPLAGFSENPDAKNPIVTLRMRTDDGVEGIGVTYFGGALTRTLRRAVDELGALTIGDDPLRVEAVAAKFGYDATVMIPVPANCATGYFAWDFEHFDPAVKVVGGRFAEPADIATVILVR